MRTARVVYRLVMLALFTAALYALWQCGGLAVRLARKNYRAYRRWDSWIFRRWSRGLAKIFGMRIAVRGIPPQKPFLLVTNHLSYIDVILLASQLGCTFISRHDVKSWPVLGHLTTRMGTIYINRERHKEVLRVSSMIEAALQRGEGIVLFAEGTSTAGAEVLPLKPSLLEFAVHSRQPVHYAALTYHTDRGDIPAHLAVCWWGEMAFASHVFSLLKLRRFEAAIAFGEAPVLAGDRKTLARELHRRLSALFIPVVKKEEL